MFKSQFRYIILTAVLLVGIVSSAAVSGRSEARTTRLPNTDVLLPPSGWVVGPQTVGVANGVTILTRPYRRSSDGAEATFTIATSTDAKLYRAGVDVPFRGNGFAVGPLDTALFTSASGHGVLVADRGPEQWVVVYATGERRGLLGTGVVGWGWGVFDAALGRPNDYYKLSVLGPVKGTTAETATRLDELAGPLFQHVASWYATAE